MKKLTARVVARLRSVQNACTCRHFENSVSSECAARKLGLPGRYAVSAIRRGYQSCGDFLTTAYRSRTSASFFYSNAAPDRRHALHEKSRPELTLGNLVRQVLRRVLDPDYPKPLG